VTWIAQQKTGGRLAIPIKPDFADVLDAIPPVPLHIVYGQDVRAYSEIRLRVDLSAQEAMRHAGRRAGTARASGHRETENEDEKVTNTF